MDVGREQGVKGKLVGGSILTSEAGEQAGTPGGPLWRSLRVCDVIPELC